jgi:hypothetical protein
VLLGPIKQDVIVSAPRSRNAPRVFVAPAIACSQDLMLSGIASHGNGMARASLIISLTVDVGTSMENIFLPLCCDIFPSAIRGLRIIYYKIKFMAKMKLENVLYSLPLLKRLAQFLNHVYSKIGRSASIARVVQV